MSERLFVIIEVLCTEAPANRLHKFIPRDGVYRLGDPNEYMWLKPERVISGDRLSYAKIKKGYTYFDLNELSSVFPVARNDFSDQALVVFPPQKEKTDIEKWLDEAPDAVCESVKDWIKEMPKLDEVGKQNKDES